MLINERPDAYALPYDPRPLEENDTVLLFRNGDVLLHVAGIGNRLPLWRDIAGAGGACAPLHAFTQDQRRVFVGTAEPDAEAPKGYAFQSVRAFRTLMPTQDGFLLNAAYHLSVWYATHRFCGACGGQTRPALHERALVCENCGLVRYPVISPAVIVALTDGDRILLARNARSTFKHYSLLAGFIEVGETAEQTVHREIMEEVGLKVKAIRYVASQPWGLSQSLMIGFRAALDGPPDITLQTSELSEARWFARSELRAPGNTASIAFDIIERFRQGKL